MDGFELLRQIYASRPGLPAILITGYPETLHRLPLLGGNRARTFTKPFEGSRLLAAISEMMVKPSQSAVS